MAFDSRLDAGSRLAARLSHLKGKKDVIILAIPRWGVEVGYAIASELGCPLDIIVSKKISFPGQEELAMGAVCNSSVIADR